MDHYRFQQQQQQQQQQFSSQKFRNNPQFGNNEHDKNYNQFQKRGKPFQSKSSRISTAQNFHQNRQDNDRDILLPTAEHLAELKHTFDKMITEKILSEADIEQRRRIYEQLRDIILAKQPDAQIHLYGSLSFGCCLNESNIMDIDIQFNDILPYETLQELLKIFHNSDFCKQIHLNTDHEPLCIDMIVYESNISVRLTSNYIRGIRLSEIIHIYTEFDQRVLPLFRLFRILSKICNIDRPDLGTLHPIVFHLMIIHFLQQINPPILPCLHEYVFGIDQVPLTLNDNQYIDFFQISNEYIRRWKSKNTTNIEMLFLQLLYYYVQEFDLLRLIIPIHTRMTLWKNKEQQMFNRKLFCADPTCMNRNLSYTMKANCSLNYFRLTLRKAFEYFSQKQTKTNVNDSLTINVVCQSATRANQLFESSCEINEYQLDTDDEEISQYDSENDSESKNNENQIDQISEFDLKTNENRQDADSSRNESVQCDGEDTREVPVLFETLAKHLNEHQKHILQREYKEQVRIFNDMMQKKLDDVKSLSNPLVDTSNSQLSMKLADVTLMNPSSANIGRTVVVCVPELMYNFQAKNFGADKGAPNVCTVCYKRDHAKSECPTLSLPDMIDLSEPDRKWIDVLSFLCRRITEQCKPTNDDIEKREMILMGLESEFQKCYPNCCAHAFGSFYNGFGFRESDLDVSVLLKDNNNQDPIQILETLCRSMELNRKMFQNIELVHNAQVPIIRSINPHFNIEIDVSLNNMLAIENTRLLKKYTEIDSRVSELGYMIKYLAKTCDISDASRGTLSSYAYIIMVIHFLQQIQPPVLPVLQQLNNDPFKKTPMIRKCDKWNVYFYDDDLTKLTTVWQRTNGSNTLPSGALWIEFLRYYTERFDYRNNVVTIRQFQPLLRSEKGWFHQTIAIEDPFVLSHNLGSKLSVQKWTHIFRVFIHARQQFGSMPKRTNIFQFNMDQIQEYFFDMNVLCRTNVTQQYQQNKAHVDNDKQNQNRYYAVTKKKTRN